jgi:hypothetical protein
MSPTRVPRMHIPGKVFHQKHACDASAEIKPCAYVAGGRQWSPSQNWKENRREAEGVYEKYSANKSSTEERLSNSNKREDLSKKVEPTVETSAGSRAVGGIWCGSSETEARSECETSVD